LNAKTNTADATAAADAAVHYSLFVHLAACFRTFGLYVDEIEYFTRINY
jgi:hypothetical protein